MLSTLHPVVREPVPLELGRVKEPFAAAWDRADTPSRRATRVFETSPVVKDFPGPGLGTHVSRQRHAVRAETLLLLIGGDVVPARRAPVEISVALQTGRSLAGTTRAPRAAHTFKIAAASRPTQITPRRRRTRGHARGG